MNFTGQLLLGTTGRNSIMGGASAGRGSDHRVVSLGGAGNDAVITPGGLDVMSHSQAYAGYSHHWTNSLNSTFSTDWAVLNNSRYQPEDAIHRAGSFHANVIWVPYTLASVGAEVMWGQRENKGGALEEAWRFQCMVKYKFN